MACGAEIVLASEKSERTLKFDENFFLDYRKTALHPNEIIKAIWIPTTTKTQFFKAFKQAQRREDDITIVTGAFLLDMGRKTRVVNSLKIAYSGMDRVTKPALEAVRDVENRVFDEEFLEDVMGKLREEFKLAPNVPGGMCRYRQTLVAAFWFKFYQYVQEQLDEKDGTTLGQLRKAEISSIQVYQV